MRQTSAAFEAPAFDNSSAGFAGHALHEAMHAFAVAHFWLVSFLWHRLLPYYL